MATPSWLGRAAARATDHPWTFGSVIAGYCMIERCSAADIAANLECTPETLMWISLCRRPSGSELADEVMGISARFGVPAQELSAIVRRVDAIAALRAGQQSAQQLIAARDRHDDNGRVE